MNITWADLGKEYPKGASKNESRYDCPFCQSNKGSKDTGGHLYANRSKCVYICHRCGSKGHISDGAKGEYHLPSVDAEVWQEVIRYLEHGPQLNTRGSLLDIPLPDGTASIEMGSEAYQYLLSRGYDSTHIARYFLRDWPERKRILVPVFMFGRMVFWVARTYNNREPKYLNPIGVPRDVIFNYDTALSGIHQYVVVVEGVTSAMTGGEVCIATVGKYVSNVQLAAIAKLPQKQFVCMLDADAQKDNLQLAQRLYSLVSPERKVYVGILRGEEDPGSISKERFAEVVGSAFEYGPFGKIDHYFASSGIQRKL